MLLTLTRGKIYRFSSGRQETSHGVEKCQSCSYLLMPAPARRRLFATSQELGFRAKRWLNDSMEAKRPDRWITLPGLEVVLPSSKEQEGGVQDLGSLVSSCLGAQAESEVDFLD